MKRIAAALVLALGLLAGPAGAQPFTAHFAPVRDQLVALRDALVEPLTKTQAKRKALLVKLIGAIDGPSDSISTDVATARAVALAAAKQLKDDPALPGLSLTLLSNLSDDLAAKVPELAGRLDDFDDSKTKGKAEKALGKVTTSLNAEAAAETRLYLRGAAGALLKAATSATAVEAALAKLAGVGGPSCANILGRGVEIDVRGSGGYQDTVTLAAAVSSDDGQSTITQFTACRDEGDFHCFSMTIPVAPEDLHVGTATTTSVSYYDGNAHNWRTTSGASVQVVEESPTRVGLCVNLALPFAGGSPGGLPDSVTVKGFVVVAR